ncbi:MAG: ribokinase [Anaerolineae bacterium]|nr:ribokinase [Anaerolineae bacterium]
MLEISLLQPIDYLVVGHLTVDDAPGGARLGGTAAYAALTAKALGLRVGVVTAFGGELSLRPLGDIPVVSFPAERSTTFENEYLNGKRQQYLRHQAPKLEYYQIPEPWRTANIVHLAPVAQEVEPGMVRNFPAALIGLTPQGWLRDWDARGRVHSVEWLEAAFVLERAGAAVISLEDVDEDENRVDELAAHCRLLAVTEGELGARLYWHGDVRRFRAPAVELADATGAGDIFAAAFFTRLFLTRDPWDAARFATQLSAISVTRVGLESIPTPEEINASLVEVF